MERKLGEIQTELAAGWDKIASKLELYPKFYMFIADAANAVNLSRNAIIVDVGCGNGSLLNQLSNLGYSNLTGVDFSIESIKIAEVKNHDIKLFIHNIVEKPLPSSFDAVFLTEVIEHVTDPEKVLFHLYNSLNPGGYLFLSFPNLQAYWPLYYLSGLHNLFKKWPRIQHWIMWFTMPYEMRSTQPVDHAYSSKDVRAFIETAGFRIIKQEGIRMLPMLRISGIDFTESLISNIEKFAHKLPFQAWYYRSMFICQKPF